jgi:excisionase family DNA binding protein
MNKKEAAEFLSISTRLVEKYASENRLGEVKYVRGKTGKQAEYDREAVEKLKVMLESPDTALAVKSPDARLFVASLVEALQSRDEPRKSVPVENKPLLKLDEAAALTGLSRQILRKAIDSEELKGKLIGRAYRIKRDDLDVFVKNL